MRQSDEPLSFVTKAPLERLLPHARPCQFCKGAVICTGEELLEAAYFILTGSCELRGALDGHEEVLETFGPGAAFGGWERGAPDEPGTRAVAAADSVLLSLTRKDLDLLRAQEGHPGRGNGNGQAHPAELSVPLHSACQPPHHLIALAYLSEQLPVPIISEQLARSLCAETTAPVVLVRLERHDGNGNGDNGAQPDLFLQGEFHMPSRVIKTEGGFYFLTLRVKNLEFGRFLRRSLAEPNPQGWQRVAGGRSGQGGSDHRKAASERGTPRRGVRAARSSARSGSEAGLAPQPGCRASSCAVARRSPPQKTPGDLRLPSGNPSDWLNQNVQTPGS